MLFYKNNYTHIILAISILIISLPMGVNAREVSNEEDLISCLSNESLCVLDSDIINDSDSIEISIENDVTLDLYGKSIKNYNLVVKNSNFTINDSIGNGTISSTAKYTVYITESNMTINGGKISSSDTAIHLDRTTGTINDGEFIGEMSGCFINRGSKITINDGFFYGISKGEYRGGYGLQSQSSKLIVNNGNFKGKVYGLISDSDGNVEIKNGNYTGEDGGIWITYSFTNLATEDPNIISGGHFKGIDGARIEVNKTNIITGGEYEGSSYGLFIECQYTTNCKETALLKGGIYTSLGNPLPPMLSGVSSAIVVRSKLDNRIKVTDLIDEDYVLSDDSILEAERREYFSYTKSLNASISKTNNQDNSNHAEIINSNKNNDLVQEVKVANTAKNNSIIIIILSGLAIILGLIIILKVKKISNKKENEI